MKLNYNKSLFIFRHDLRIDDNIGLLNAAAQSESIVLCFIFDEYQESNTEIFNNNNALQFMIESLQNLQNKLHENQGKLHLFNGKTETIIKDLIKHESIDAIFLNKSYIPSSIKQEEIIKELCLKANIACELSHDFLLNEPNTVKSLSGRPYEKFTPFFKNASKFHAVAKPQKFKTANFYTKKIDSTVGTEIYKIILKEENPRIDSHGGRDNGLKIFKNLKHYEDYDKERDYPNLEATTHLSAHLAFGTVSVREAYYAIKEALGINHTLVKQLYWRDFFAHVAYYSPFVFGHSYQKKYDALWWENDKKKFTAWCQGTTGFPIVDAGMRQLNATGFMHNRVRMIVASFLTKDLHIDWRWGEKYFAQKLIDYDPAVNNGNWQWCASTGCDAQPYFRIFNPWLQQKKFDNNCEYIKQWIPELKNIAAKTIHLWFKLTSPAIKEYPRPIVEHAKESVLAKKLYKQC
ncbi:MAG: deoxyribodipyrimidine photo-lyase [Candidatus Dependentiae bacterium]|nr:deoxyribodipyrimidine photo-lyase [Candidatus Dependentiae bacterium]